MKTIIQDRIENTIMEILRINIHVIKYECIFVEKGQDISTYMHLGDKIYIFYKSQFRCFKNVINIRHFSFYIFMLNICVRIFDCKYWIHGSRSLYLYVHILLPRSTTVLCPRNEISRKLMFKVLELVKFKTLDSDSIRKLFT